MDSRIVQLARSIVDHTTAIDGYLREKKLADFSFDDIDAPPLRQLSLHKDIETARQTAIAAAEELGDLLKGPAAPLFIDWSAAASLRVIVQLQLADLVPLRPSNGVGTPFADVAAKTRLSESRVRRLLRHSMTRRIFCEPHEGLVAHTPASALLVRDAAVRDMVTFGMLDLWPAGLRLADALQRWPDSDEPRDTGFAWANVDCDTGIAERKSMWDVHVVDAERARRFGIAMTIGESGIADSSLEGVEWKGKKVVDVGGGRGAVAIQAARKVNNVEFIVQDSPQCVEEGKASLPPELQGRVQFIAHDFFSVQPVKDADIYFFRWIFHDWSNKYALKIIRNLIPAMKPGARVLVNEWLVPKAGTVPRQVAKSVVNFDLTMMALFNGQERDLEEWKALFREADQRFKFVGFKADALGLLALIEFEWHV